MLQRIPAVFWAIALIWGIAVLFTSALFFPRAVMHAFFTPPSLMLLMIAPSVVIATMPLLLMGLVPSRMACAVLGCAWLVLVVAVTFFLPSYLNGSLAVQAEQLVAGDKDWDGFQTEVGTLAVLRPSPFADGASSTGCGSLCQRLLYNGAVRAFLAVERPSGSPVSPFDPKQKAVRYRIAQPAICPSVEIPRVGAWPWENAPRWKPLLSDRTLDRIAAGDCLIAEPAVISDADAIVYERPILPHRPAEEGRPGILRLNVITAHRLTVFVRKADNAFQEVFSRTSVTIKPVASPLHTIPDTTCILTREWCVPDIARLGQEQRGVYDFVRLFAGKFGLNVQFISPEIAHDVITRRLRAALADPTLPSRSPHLKISGKYMANIVARGSVSDDDIEILSAIIRDRRYREFSDYGLNELVQRIGQPAAPLAVPLMEGIVDAPPMHLSKYVIPFVRLPPKAALQVMPQLRKLAEDPLKRRLVAPVLRRLADAGESSVPLLLQLAQDDGRKAAPNSDVYEVARNGVIGLCLLGPEAASAAPALFDLVREDIQRNSRMTNFGSLAIGALLNMGKRSELETLMDEADLRAQLTDFAATKPRYHTALGFSCGPSL